MGPLTGLSKYGMLRLESVYTLYMGTLPPYAVCISMKRGKGNPIMVGTFTSLTCEFEIHIVLMSS